MSVELSTALPEHSVAIVKRGTSSRRSSKAEILQKALSVQICTQPSLIHKDIVWLNREDFKELFGDLDKDVPRYLQVVNQVFQVCSGKISKSFISIPDVHSDSICDAFYPSIKHSMVSVTSFDPQKSPPFLVQSIEFDITVVTRYFTDDEQCLCKVEEIEKRLTELLQGKFLSRKHAYILQFPWGTLKARIASLQPVEPTTDINFSFGLINSGTTFKLRPHLSKEVYLIDEVISKGIDCFNFCITPEKRAQDAAMHTLPLVLQEEVVLKLIHEKLDNKVIGIEHFILLPLSSGWDAKIRFKQANFEVETFQKAAAMGVDYKKGFFFTPTTRIKLEPAHNLIISGGKPELVQEISFKILDMPGNQSIGIDQNKERWVCLDEFKKALLLMERPFVSKEIFELRLSSGAFLVGVRKALSDEPGFDPERNIEKRWLIDEHTEIEIIAEKQLGLNLLKDEKVREIKKAYFQIISTKFNDEDSKWTLPELTVLGLMQTPDRLVNQHRFTVIRSDGERLELKLLRADFGPVKSLKAPLTSFGKWTENTYVDFSLAPSNPITLLEKIYSDEIESMRFSLRVTKQTETSKHARTPLIFNRDEIIKKIREELEEHRYITIGHKIPILIHEGWELEAMFRRGVLTKVEGKRDEEKSLIHSQVIKRGFAPGKDTPIDLSVGGIDMIALSQGEPIMASRIHLSVAEVLEDYTNDDSSIVKGGWLNLEELKKEALKLKKSYVRGEKIVFDLESGRYVIEVHSAKPKDIKAKFPKKRNEAPWIIDSDTKVEVKIDPSLNLKIVDKDFIYPLKKVKFIVTHQSEKAEHANIKENELREALKEVLPEKLIKGQVLTLETKRNHTIRAEVDELHLADELLNVDKSRIFVQISDNTEILFRAKETKKDEKSGIFGKIAQDSSSPSGLAINADPKILEVDDPIEYLENLGMGGLDNEFKKVFRIFLSRSAELREEARRRGTKPIKGMLFYGPAGTGKTTLARHIGEMMGCSGERLQLLTATEIFNKWFGESEENIRDLFAPARKAQEEYRDKSPLYIIIIDEIDALLPKRGAAADSVREPLVNQFLGEMDGLKELNNLLVIGITNRKDDIDPAALRHGRLGEHVEIGLPDKKSRIKIFGIHTRRLAKEGLLGPDVKLDLLADKTDKCPGAAIEGIVEAASLYSLERLAKLKCPKKELRTHPDGIVTMKDMLTAIKETMSQVKNADDLSESGKSMFS